LHVKDTVVSDVLYVKRTTRLWTHPSFTHVAAAAAAAAAAVQPRFISRILTFSGDASRYKISMCGMRFVSRFPVVITQYLILFVA